MMDIGLVAATSLSDIPVRVATTQPWSNPATRVIAHGVAVVHFGSGRDEFRQWAGAALIPGNASRVTVLEKLDNLRESLLAFQRMAEASGWPRHNRRGRRRFQRIEWKRA